MVIIWYQFPNVTAQPAQPGVTTWVAATARVSVIAANLSTSYSSKWDPGWIKTEWRLSSHFSFQVGKILVILWATRLSQFLAASESWLLGTYVISSTTLALQTQSNHLRWSHNPADSDTFGRPGSSIKLRNIDSRHHISTKICDLLATWLGQVIWGMMSHCDSSIETAQTLKGPGPGGAASSFVHLRFLVGNDS